MIQSLSFLEMVNELDFGVRRWGSNGSTPLFRLRGHSLNPLHSLVQHLHLTRHRAGEIACLPLVHVAVDPQAPLDEDQPPYGQILLAYLTQASSGFYDEPIGSHFRFALTSPVASRDGYAERAHLVTFVCKSRLGVLDRVPEQLHAV
jgi:hypothetical protein